jgi:hypothetical protein
VKRQKARNLIKLSCIEQDNKTGDFMKRTVFLALALFALMAVGVYAQTEADFVVSKSKDGKSITITGYKDGKATAVVIPARIQNLPVTEIESSVFDECYDLTSVTIPNTVTSIVSGAFTTTYNLTSVTFQGSIPASGFATRAFSSSLGDIRDKYFAAGGGAGTYTKPNGNSKIWTKSASATAAPTSATKLEFTLTADKKGYIVSKDTGSVGDVVIPASYNNLPVTEIGNQAFASYNTNINSVIIPNSVTKIGMLAFQGWATLKSVTIGSGVIDINRNAFASCVVLNSVTFGGANTRFSDTEFPNGGDLMNKYKAGGAGTYTRSGSTWTKK